MEVSIVICTRNRARSLPASLSSIAAIKTELDWEALIIDNASDDDTAAVIRSADDCGGRLRYGFVADIGLGAARDAAWRMAHGSIVCFSDDDCYFDPGYIDAIVAAFSDASETGCIGGRILLHDPLDARVTIDERDYGVDYPPRHYLAAGELHGANLSFRRNVLEHIGGFDPNLGAGTPYPCEDVDAVARAIWAGYHARYDPRPTVRHHHGRREKDLPGIIKSYDQGRGAYLIKFMTQPMSRRVYVRAWWRSLKSSSGSSEQRSRRREVISAVRWLVGQRRFLTVPLALGGATIMGAGAVVVHLIRQVRHSTLPRLR